MLNELFDSILSSSTNTSASIFTFGEFMLCSLCSLVLGVLIAAFYMYRNNYSKGFVITLSLLPMVVQVVILLVNGNLGAGVAVAGAFSLVRFRSAQGSAREICSIFLAMAVGLATGMGYLGVAVLLTLLVGLANMLLTALHFGEPRNSEKVLRITIPEDLDYTGVFDDLFTKYTRKHELVQVKTTNMGSLYKLQYNIELKDAGKEKEFLDALRCRNGNLEIAFGQIAMEREVL